MRFSFTEQQREFAGGLRDMLEREFTTAHLRAVWESGTGVDEQLWHRLAEMGVLGSLVAESDGGLGGNLVDAVLLIEELGRAAVPGPIAETMVVGALALGAQPAGPTSNVGAAIAADGAPGEATGGSGSRSSTDSFHAADIAAGTTRVTAALFGERYVPHRADLILLRDIDGVRVVDSTSVQITDVPGIDGGRLLTSVLGAEHTGTFVACDVDALADAGSLAVAAYLLGVSARMLDIAAAHARDRHQFGQPIGSFQAVKHLMADALLQVEFARPAVYRAAWSCATDADDRERDVSMAKALASEAAQTAARSALQVHGAIGYTWEHDLHLLMKKAWALIPAWGAPAYHRRRVADAVLGRRIAFGS